MTRIKVTKVFFLTNLEETSYDFCFQTDIYLCRLGALLPKHNQK